MAKQIEKLAKIEKEGKWLVLDHGQYIIPANAAILEIVQIYLRTASGEWRIRKTTTSRGVIYETARKFKTKVKDERDEDEKEIGCLQYYFLLLFFREIKCRVIKKTRYEFYHHQWLCQYDVFHGWAKPHCTVEVELKLPHQQVSDVELPPTMNASNITGDKRFSNRAIAEHGIPKL